MRTLQTATTNDNQVTAPPTAVVISRVEQGVVRILLATEEAALPSPATLEDGAVVWLLDLAAFDESARLIISEFLDRGWFTLADVLAHVQVLPVHGGGRAARRREERGQ